MNQKQKWPKSGEERPSYPAPNYSKKIVRKDKVNQKQKWPRSNEERPSLTAAPNYSLKLVRKGLL